MAFLGITPGEILALLVMLAIIVLVVSQVIDIGRRLERRRARAASAPERSVQGRPDDQR